MEKIFIQAHGDIIVINYRAPFGEGWTCLKNFLPDLEQAFGQGKIVHLDHLIYSKGEKFYSSIIHYKVDDINKIPLNAQLTY